MRNPLQKIKEKNGWSIREFASVAGMSFTATYNCLNGNTQKINQRILKAVEQMGYDPEEIKKEYQEYREAKQQELMQEAI
ncbi:MAG: hypothetical protein ACOCQN_00580 [Halanaerobiaceae bacterium]